MVCYMVHHKFVCTSILLYLRDGGNQSWTLLVNNNVVGNIDVNSTSGISTFNGLEISGIVTAKAGAAVTYYGDGSNLTGITSPAITSIGSDGTARVLTSDGDGTATAHSEVKIVTFSSNL